ncbi:hypothetical protein EDC01DRAFT_682746 [Geopyxis carbonaria]|nr:hypothetical protein EDC01DRAFT_682746 [Geopyxis carbonaria]
MEEDYQVQTPCYRAPEVLLGAGRLSRRIDIWSLGVIALQLLLDGEPVGDTGVEGAELLMPAENTLDGMVRRVIELFGSVQCCRRGRFWRPAFAHLSVRWGRRPGEREPYPVAEKTGLVGAVLRRCGDEGLARWLRGMVAVDPRERVTVVQALRDPWAVRTVLGEWGAILMAPDGGGGGEGGREWTDDEGEAEEDGNGEGEGEGDVEEGGKEDDDITEIFAATPQRASERLVPASARTPQRPVPAPARARAPAPAPASAPAPVPAPELPSSPPHIKRYRKTSYKDSDGIGTDYTDTEDTEAEAEDTEAETEVVDEDIEAETDPVGLL